MASTNHTENLGLSLWEPEDRPERGDFVQDNQKLDTLLGGHLADALLHVTEEDKEILQRPYFIYPYIGNGNDVNYTDPAWGDMRAVIILCATRPPVMSDGTNTITYWNFWALDKDGNVVGNAGNSLDYKFVSGKYRLYVYNRMDSNDNTLRYRMNERNSHYLAVLFPKYSWWPNNR